VGAVGSPAFAVIRRRWWVIAITAVLAVGVAVVGLSVVTPQYQATATLQVPITTGVLAPTDLTYNDRLMNTYASLTQQASLRATVARQVGLSALPTLAVTIDTNTELMELSARNASATVAERTANTAASVLVANATRLALATSRAGENALGAQLNALSNTITALQVQLASVPAGASFTSARLTLQERIHGQQADYAALVQQRAQLQLADAVHDQTLSVVQPAAMPTSPASPRWPPVLALALAIGLLGGIALAFSLERFRPRLYTMEAIESAGDATVLAAIPKVKGKLKYGSLYNGGSPAQEAFGVIAAQVLTDAQARGVHMILVTSSSKGDGKSTVAANLATELARSRKRVVLVDADMRAPAVHRIFGLEAAGGLSELLASAEPASQWDEFIVQSDEVPNLGVLTAGSEHAEPARLLASGRLPQLVEALRQHTDFVVFDAPPLVVSDPLSVARLADLVVLIVGGYAVPDREIHAARRRLRSVGAEHVAIVVNRWNRHDPAYSYSYSDRGSA
jgi:capsular exopolysaccharide synthesis family protein